MRQEDLAFVKQSELGELRALTLHRPWPWIFFVDGKVWPHVAGAKDIENRPWSPPSEMRGRDIALHAGKVWDHAGRDKIAELSGYQYKEDADHVAGVIVGVARYTGFVTRDDNPTSPWFFGPIGWKMENQRLLKKPIVVPRGYQGLWRVTRAVQNLIAEQVGELKP